MASADPLFAGTLFFGAPTTVEEASQMLKAFYGITGRPLIVCPAMYEAMKSQGIDLTYVKRNDPLPVRP